MRFLIDENLSPELITVFEAHGLKAHHVNQMKGHKKQRIRDDQLRRLTINSDYVIVTKDDDFVKSFVDRKVPEKVVFIFGLENKSELLHKMDMYMDELKSLIQTQDFLEINAEKIRTPFA